jgi:hypothetical protein
MSAWLSDHPVVQRLAEYVDVITGCDSASALVGNGKMMRGFYPHGVNG